MKPAPRCLKIAKKFSSNSNAKHRAFFAGANGIPVLCFTPLIEKIQSAGCFSEIIALDTHAVDAVHTKYEMPEKYSFTHFAEDLICFLEQDRKEQQLKNNNNNNNKNKSNGDNKIVAVTHSLSATSTCIAASKRPDLFKACVFQEPANVRPRHRFIMEGFHLFKATELLYQFEPMKSARAKKDFFVSKEECFQTIRADKAYRRISDENLRIFVDHYLTASPSGDGFECAFAKSWEERIFTRPDSVAGKFEKIELSPSGGGVKLLSLVGRPSIFVSPEVHKLLQSRPDVAKYVQSEANGHLLPLENPDFCAKEIVEFVNNLN